LTLKSTGIANTAVVAPVTGSITGNVTVERFIPNGFRVYRDLGAGGVAPTTSIFANWQENGTSNNGYGTQITGLAGTPGSYDNASGFDYSLYGGASLFTYKISTWDSLTVAKGGTKGNTLDPFQGYRLLIRGNRTNDLSQQYAINMTSSATLRSTGSLVYGNVTYNVGSVASTNNYSTTSGLASGANSYSFISNPYASVVDWESVITTNSSNMNENYWYCDPTFTTGGNGVNFIGYTQFVAYSATAHTSSNTFSKSNVGRYLQPGQAIFVQNPASGTPSLKFTESCKVPAQAKTGVFGTTAVNRIAVGLFKNGANLDGTVSVFDKNFSNGYGNEDAVKFANATENMTFKVAGKDLAINGYTLPTSTDVLPIRLSNLVINTAYEIKLDASQFIGNGLQAYLKDNVSNTKTLLSGTNNSINFTTTSVDVASYTNRYSIVFNAGVLPVSDIKLTATTQAGDVQIAWSVIGESNLASYTVQHSIDGASFSSISTVAANNSASYSVTDSKALAGTNYYRVKVSSNDGTVTYSNVVELTINNSPLTTISAYPNPLVGAKLNVSFNHLDAGKYSIAVYNVLGAKVAEKSVSHNGGNAVEQLSINSHLAAGAYTVRVINANGVSYQSQIEVK